MSSVTVRDLDILAEEIKTRHDIVDGLEEMVKIMNKELSRLEHKAVLVLKDLERDQYDSPHGKMKIEEKWRVNLPETITDKLEFFEYLKEKGVFETYATVNSNSLQSFYFAEKDSKPAEEQVIFSMPGIPAPKLYEKLRFKRSKE